MSEIDTVEAAAQRGAELPPGLSIFDQMRFHGLSQIYYQFKRGEIDRPTATAWKQSFLRELTELKRQFDFALRCYNNAATRYMDTEAAVTAFLKDKTIANAEAIVAALHGADITQKGEKSA